MLQYYERGTVAHLQRRTLNRQSSLQMQQARHFAALPHAMRQGTWLLHNTVTTIAGRVLHMDTPTKEAPTLVCQHLQQVAANAPLQQPPPAAALHPAAAPTACKKPFCFFQKTILLQRKIQGRSRSCCTMPTPPPQSASASRRQLRCHAHNHTPAKEIQSCCSCCCYCCCTPAAAPAAADPPAPAGGSCAAVGCCADGGRTTASSRAHSSWLIGTR